ncbi:MAG TPA: hypothetical protein VGM88_11320 [Kofleriaceae bacterium]|jgi:hypothetical protein
MRSAALVVLLAACSGGGSEQPAPDAGADAPLGPLRHECTAPVDIADAGYQAPATCTSEQADIVGRVADLADFRYRVVGQWLQCSFPSVWGTNDEAGFEIHDDGTWANLYADASGTLTASTDPTTSGTFDIQQSDPSSIQLDMTRASDSGEIILQPYFADTPAMMRVTNEGLYTADYIRNDDSGRCAAVTPDPAAGPYTAPASCATSPANEVTSPDPTTALVGRWFTCDGSPFAMGSDNGIELVADGSFFRLYAAADGTMQREHGFDRQGTWSVDASGQLTLEIASGFLYSQPLFGDGPETLVIDNEGLYTGHYVHE